MTFISSTFLIAVARTSSTVLNSSGESRHPCLIPDLNGNTFSFCPLSMMLAVVFPYIALLYWGVIPLFPLCWELFHKWVLDFIKCFSCFYWYDHVIFILNFFVCCITFIDLQILYQPCIPGMNPTWLWHTFFNVFLDPVGKYVAEDFSI